jgi:peptide/nickel transport system permease protein
MMRRLARQLEASIPAILATTLISFALIHTAPGGPASILSQDTVLAPQQRQALRICYGLGLPLAVRYEVSLWPGF